LQIGAFATVFVYMLFVGRMVAIIAFTFFVPSLVLTPFMQQQINHYSAQRIEGCGRYLGT
jgi:preprotein translocase subunit SecG